jgi:CrcB protein
MNVMPPLLLVAIGGAFGSMARYSVSAAISRMTSSAFPWGTLAVNVAGSFLIGLLMIVLLKAGEWRENSHFLLITGVMGGFTTFSSFSWETVKLLEDGRLLLAVTNIFASVAICLLATLAGALLARQF